MKLIAGDPGIVAGIIGDALDYDDETLADGLARLSLRDRRRLLRALAKAM